MRLKSRHIQEIVFRIPVSSRDGGSQVVDDASDFLQGFPFGDVIEKADASQNIPTSAVRMHGELQSCCRRHETGPYINATSLIEVDRPVK